MLQGDPSNLRNKRTSVDTGTGETRLSDSGRSSHVGRGTFINWQDDLGVSTANDTAKKLRDDNKTFSDESSRVKGLIDKANTDLAAVSESLDKDKVTIHMYNGRNVSTYVLPRSVANDLASKSNQSTIWSQEAVDNPFRQGDRAVAPTIGGYGATTGLSDRDKYYMQYDINTGEAFKNTAQGVYKNIFPTYDVTRAAGYEDKILHFNVPSSDLSWEYAKKLGPASSNYTSQLAELEKSIATTKMAVDNSAGVLKGNTEQRQAEWDKVHSDYAKRQETMKKILGGLNFG